MQRNRLGRTDIMVTDICLGTMTWGVQNTQAEGHAQIDYALDAGVNFMDTAEVYAIPGAPETYGKTETIIGTWFKNNGKRDRWILASKVAGGQSNPWVRNGDRPTRAGIFEAVEGSLKRLQTDYIDLYQIHWPARPHAQFEKSWAFDAGKQDPAETHDHMLEALDALGDMVKQGKIRHVGVSNESAWGIGKFLTLAEKHDLPRLVSVQNEYNLIRRHFDLDLSEVTQHEQVGLLAYSPLASGILTGKYLDGATPAGTRGALQRGGLWRNNEFSAPAVRAYIDIAQKHGLDIAQMAIAFCLTRHFMTSVIIGATSMAHLKTNIAAADLVLDDAVLADINAVHRLYPRTI